MQLQTRAGVAVTTEIIRGYEILEPFRIVGGGQSRWTFARKDTRNYFIKQFLSPTYPTPESPRK